MEQNVETRNQSTHTQSRSTDLQQELKNIQWNRICSSTNGVDKTGNPQAKKILDFHRTLYTKINSKCIKELNKKLEIVSFLEENIVETVMTLGSAMISWM